MKPLIEFYLYLFFFIFTCWLLGFFIEAFSDLYSKPLTIILGATISVFMTLRNQYPKK